MDLSPQTDSEAELPALELVPPGPLRERLVDAVLRGVKTVTSRLLVMDERDATVWESPGTRLRLVDSEGTAVAVVEIEEIRILRLGDVGDDVAVREGDWFPDAAAWRVAHERYWTGQLESLRAFLDDPEWRFDATTPVVVRYFRPL